MFLVQKNIVLKINNIFNTIVVYITTIIKNIGSFIYKIYIINKTNDTFYITNCLLLLCVNIIIIYIINYLCTRVIKIFKNINLVTYVYKFNILLLICANCWGILLIINYTIKDLNNTYLNLL